MKETRLRLDTLRLQTCLHQSCNWLLICDIGVQSSKNLVSDLISILKFLSMYF